MLLRPTEGCSLCVFLIHKMYSAASFAIKEQDTVAATKLFTEIKQKNDLRAGGREGGYLLK